MLRLPQLKPGDSVEIIAPSSRCSDQQLKELKELLLSWQLNVILADDIFGNDLLCANSDEYRFSALKKALYNPETKAIIAARGGYGCARLIPELSQLNPPSSPKIFVGMSDLTALNLYLLQNWQWSVLHAAPVIDKFSPESINAIKSILFAEENKIELTGLALNNTAENSELIQSSITGGNLCLIQASIGTNWQIDTKNKILLLEETGERGYKIDRMLEHLSQSHLFDQASAILFGDFIKGNEPNGISLIPEVLKRFATTHSNIPIIQIQGIGHDYTNFPIPFGCNTQLKLGKEIKLVISR